ncbi:aminotransferase class I/II-fold pyridoxal phosphate-dependent enzyme [Mucilaginibacter litoreus]|uniref:Aminotransferase class I/II-fold pyridoxal phosphate-dependent enzyme n=1 Tax=Mucilaginibacter litoreus TaxID=1048221 RepID=A0ABW3ASS2_9SPHI
MSSANTYIYDKLRERSNLGLYRTLTTGRGLIDFCSNDYLGFARSEALKDLIRQEHDSQYPVLNGATGSRLISGNMAYTEAIEQHLAAYYGSQAGLLFNSGYDANLGLFSSLPQKGDTIICDELIHASIIDGARLSYANRYTFKHNDLDSLESKLKAAKGLIYVVIESVYSMDGDTPPIARILELTDRYGANLIVDEAHAVGLYPAGLVKYLNLENKIFARIITFGKALGCHGAIVLGKNPLREYLINFARSFIYTTALPFHSLVAIKMAHGLLQESTETITKLRENIKTYKQVIPQYDAYSESPIQCVILGSNSKAKQAAAALQQEGLDVRAILSPTVGLGTERIRICLHAFNTFGEIQQLSSALNKISNA